MLFILRKLPFVIPALAIFNMAIIELSHAIGDSPFKDKLNEIISIQFKQGTPIYFNYWIIYVGICAVIAVVMGIVKKYNFLKTVLAVCFNVIVCVLLFLFITSMM